MGWRRSFAEYALFLASFCVQHLRYARKSLPAELRSILVVKLDHLGDVLLSLPVVMNLREAYPDAHLTVLAGSWMRSLLEVHPTIDEVLCYDAPFFARGRSPTPWRERLRLLATLRSRDIDLVVDLRGSWLTLGYAALGGPHHRLDRASRNVVWRFQKDAPHHELERNLALLHPLPTPHRIPTWPVPPAQVMQSWQFLQSLGIFLTRPISVLHPGSPVPLKRWSPDRFAALATRLIREFDAQVVLVGTDEEREIGDQIQAQVQGAIWNLIGQTSLMQLAGILRNSTLFVGNDSGPMHLAAAVGIPTVGLFGPSDAARFGPVGPHVRRLQAPVDCPPCMGDRCVRGERSCLDQITVEDVWQAIEELLLTR